MQFAAPAVPDVRGRGVEALTPGGGEQTGELRDEPFTDRIRLGQHPSEKVDDDPGPAGRLAMRGEDAQQTARSHRRGGERPLGLQRPLQLAAFCAGAVREHRLGHRDERHRVRHGQQRHPYLVGGRDQPFRRPLVGKVGAQPQPDGLHSGGVEFGQVGPTCVGGVR